MFSLITAVAAFSLVTTTAAAFTGMADTRVSFESVCGSSVWNSFCSGLGL